MPSRPSRPRLDDVAARSGVSTASVSLVLRGLPGPSDATRRSVLQAASDLGYRPDRTASLLARRRSHLLGVLLDITSSFHAELVLALDDAAAGRGLDLVLATVTRQRDEARAAETLLDSRCEAIVAIGPVMAVTGLDALASAAPVVVVGRAGTSRVPGVRTSDDQGLELAVDHLVGLGHGRIAFVDGPRGTIATARRRGYRAAMRRHGLGGQVRVLPGGATEEGGVRAARGLLGPDAPDRPTAVVCFNDRVAIGLRDTLLRAGWDVPRDLSVVGYDDTPLARLGTVDLTSVSQDPRALAEAAVALVADHLGAQTAPEAAGAAAAGGAAGDAVIAPRLAVRSSTSSPGDAPLPATARPR